MKTLIRSLFTLSILCVSGQIQAQTSTQTRVYFESNSSELDQNTQNKIVQWIKTNASEHLDHIKVIGYTDASGSTQKNLILSKQRAEAVVAILKMGGLKGEDIEMDFKGEEAPIAPNTTETGKGENRRVELTWVYKMLMPKKLLPAIQKFTIDAEKGADVIVGPYGTLLHVPANAFVDAKGDIVRGRVSLEFQEFRNAAEMAFSGIPMTYKDGLFNSAGMFDLKGYSNEKAIEIARDKSITIDYALANKHKDLGFYQLDEESGTWKKLKDLEALETSHPQFENEKVRPDGSAIEVQVDMPQFEGANVMIERLGRKSDWKAMARTMRPGDTVDAAGNKRLTTNGNITDAGHYYPSIISGLSIKSFGVYNCDQVYRLKDRVAIKATYVDEKNREIVNTSVLSMIDLRYEGAFSFPPGKFTCSAAGRNVLLLFTFDKRLYALSEEAFAKQGITRSGAYTFQMTDITHEVANSEELANYLFPTR